MSGRAVQEVPGYGEKLRKELATMKWTQADLAEQSGVSRQTISRAINHDQVSEQTMSRVAAVLGTGFDHRSQGRRESGKPRPIPGTTLCNATDLMDWANRRQAQGILPRAIRRLILATGAGVTKLHMRTDEGVSLPDWDGLVHADSGTPFLPKGASGWEMSVGKNPKAMADGNWEKRTKDSGTLEAEDATFVFVTPRRWPGKEEWAKQKADDGPWRDVRALDADDMAAWLEEAPAVHTWLSIQIGKRPHGIIDLQSFWEDWRQVTRPSLPPRFLLSGRQQSAMELGHRLDGRGERVIGIRAESQGEAVAWLYCAINERSPETAEAFLARCVIVESRDAFRHLGAAGPSLVLLPIFDWDDEIVAGAARAGQLVVVPSDEDHLSPGDGVIRIGSLCRWSAGEALQKIGLPADKAHLLAGLASRSLTAFRRKLSRSDVQRRPAWSKPTVARSLVPALLAGSWNEGIVVDDVVPRDREAIAELGKRGYDEVAESLENWTSVPDPPVRNRGSTWHLVSVQDAWELLAKYVRRDDLERFSKVAKDVLGRVDPRFDIPPGERWMAGAFLPPPKYSDHLRRGLATTLATLGVHVRKMEHPVSAGAGQIAEQVVRDLLGAANNDWRLWASLSRQLRLLSEAAPDSFLDAVEADLGSGKPVLAELFPRHTYPLAGAHPYVELVVALEALAPEYPGQIVPILAQLDELDPISELRPGAPHRSGVVNRPHHALRSVFRTWLPETSTPIEDKLAVLDRLRTSHGRTAWYLMLSMRPERLAIAEPPRRPLVRETSNVADPPARGDSARWALELAGRLVEDAGTSGDRWAELINRLLLTTRPEHDRIVSALERLDPGTLQGEDRAKIWAALSSVIARSSSLARMARPTMLDENPRQFDRLLDRFAPNDLMLRYRRLFEKPFRPRFEEGDETGVAGYREALDRRRDDRVEAVRALFDKEGLRGILDLARAVDDPGAVGHAAADESLGECQTGTLLAYLAHSETPLAQMATAYAARRASGQGPEWVAGKLDCRELDPTATQRANLLLALPVGHATWEIVRGQCDEVSTAYWRLLDPGRIEEEDVPEAVENLLAAGRPFVAAKLLADRVDSLERHLDLVADVLEMTASTSVEFDAPGRDFGYHAEFLLDALASHDSDAARLARLEWRLMPALDDRARPPETLHGLLAKDPAFFVEMLSLVYRQAVESPEAEPEEMTRQDEMRAAVAFRVLDSWNILPGSQDDHEVDATELRNWVGSARSSLGEAGLTAKGLEVIGGLFSHSPYDADGTWPIVAVREIIQELDCRDLERGFVVGALNRRGPVVRDLAGGGAEETSVADAFDGLAVAVRATHPRTARILRRLRDSYRENASHLDHMAVEYEDW